MEIMYQFLCISLILLPSISAVSILHKVRTASMICIYLFWFQQGMKGTLEKLELISYNKNIVKDVKFVVFQYNQTHQAINASGYLLDDLGMKLIVSHAFLQFKLFNTFVCLIFRIILIYTRSATMEY